MAESNFLLNRGSWKKRYSQYSTLFLSLTENKIKDENGFLLLFLDYHVIITKYLLMIHFHQNITQVKIEFSLICFQ